MQVKDRCTFFLSSYDGGKDCWAPFFQAVRMQWPQMDLPIVINTESEDFSYPGYEIKSLKLLHPGKKIPWGRRLIEALKRVDTEYIILFLEDYWLDHAVDDAHFRRVIEWMDADPQITAFIFSHHEGGEANIRDDRYEGYELRPKHCEYLLNAQVGVWRTKRLIELTRPHESPWEWEIWGSERAARYEDKIYVRKAEAEVPFPYFTFGDLKGRTGVICRGQWDKEMIDGYKEIYDLSSIDFNLRGYKDFSKSRESERPTTISQKIKAYIIDEAVLKYHKWLSLR